MSHCPDGSDEAAEWCAARSCPAHLYRCSTGRCVEAGLRCDGRDGCGDWSDEAGCPCPAPSIQCRAGPCLPHTAACNGVPDCPDASDEVGCPAVNCSAGLVQCDRTTNCILPEWRCDGQDDCWDGGDERGCREEIAPSSCPVSTFQCSNGRCIKALSNIIAH